MTLIFAALLLSGCVHATIDQRRVFEGARPCAAHEAVEVGVSPVAIESRRITIADDVALNALVLRPSNARGTLIYFGGNAIRHCEAALRDSSSAQLLHDLAQLELNIVLVNYRGYGGSQGKPAFDVVKQDALAVYDAVVESDLRAPIMVHGQSLGTLFAATLAAHRPVSRVVLESPPTTYGDVISAAVPWYAKLFVRIELTPEVARESTLPVAARVYQPTLVIVGSKDPVTPPAMARRVHAALGARQKDLRIIRTGRHGDLIRFEEYWRALSDFLNRPGAAQHH